MTIAPCAYPGCRDEDGNPRLTDQTICAPSRVRYRTTLRALALDYVTIRTTWPRPATSTNTPTRTKPTSPGHPNEWASDTLLQIAATLDEAENGIRDHLGHTPAGPLRTTTEPRIVSRAWRYLDTHLDTLATYPGARATAVEITDLHHRIRNQLGQTRLYTRLPTPCPDCLLTTLVRTLDRDRRDSISCDNCGRDIHEEHYGLYARVLIDELIDQADDTPEAEPA